MRAQEKKPKPYAALRAMMAYKSKRLTIRGPEKLIHMIKREAVEKGVSMNHLMNAILSKGFLE